IIAAFGNHELEKKTLKLFGMESKTKVDFVTFIAFPIACHRVSQGKTCPTLDTEQDCVKTFLTLCIDHVSSLMDLPIRAGPMISLFLEFAFSFPVQVEVIW
ncbi:hypothetical protein Ancab_039060, partial [Ancistrocladus abbreviatus]